MATIGERLEELWEESPGLRSWLGTVDHKRIGKRYCYTAFLFFVVGGVEAMLVRTQLAPPRRTPPQPRGLQRDVLDARHHHDLLLHHPGCCSGSATSSCRS